jgi:uncharacterized membrane protein
VHTTVTGIFSNHQQADAAHAKLMQAGFAASDLRVVDAATRERHQFIHQRTSDTGRAVWLGIVSGLLSGLLAGFLFTWVFEGWTPVALGGLVGGVGGLVLGFLVGRTTTSQVEDEIEHQVDEGAVLVSVSTTSHDGPRVMELLAQQGGVNLVSTAASFTGGVLPTTRRENTA